MMRLATHLMLYGVTPCFFVWYFVFLQCTVDPAAIFSSNGFNIHNYVVAMHAQDVSASSYADPAFRRLFILELTPEYLRETASVPGGWTRLAVTLCIYACHYPVAGALVLTGLALFFFWIFPLYMQGTGVQRPFAVGFVPPLFLLTICAWYELSDLVFLLPVAGALAFAVFFRRLQSASAALRVVWLSLLFWSAWYLMQWGGLLFLFFAVISEFFNKERGSVSVMIAAAVNGALFCALDALLLPLPMAIRWSDFTELSGQPLAVIVFFPLAAIILAVWGRLWSAPAGKAAAVSAIMRTLLTVCGIVAAAVWLYREPVNRDTRTIARTVFHSMNGKWEAVLKEETKALFADISRRVGPLQKFMVHAVDHALCRTGRLGDSLFSFPQAVFSDDPLLMIESTHTRGYVNWVVVLDLAMDLGMVNMAEKIAGEIMENVGPYPDIIYRRSLIQIAKGNRDAAAVYLHKLARMPFCRTEAKRLLCMLDHDGALTAEPRIAALRANMDTADYVLFTVSYEASLKNLLQSNPGNKAAFDYLMTHYLLTGRLDGAADLAQRARTVGYAGLPRSWEEALCVYRAANAQQAPFDGVQRETAGRFDEFVRAYAALADDPEAAAKLSPAFGETYFFYSIFRYAPGKRHE